MKTTLEKLQDMSPLFKCNLDDLDKANKLITLIEASCKSEQPRKGDVVIYTNTYGQYYPDARVDEIFNKEIGLCERASVYVSSSSNISMSISGGSFPCVPSNKLIYKGKTEARFWTFGHRGATAHGGIYFTAEVSLWECNMNESEFSTKNRDLYYISYSKDPDCFGYRWFLRTPSPCRAWCNESEAQAWLRTHRAVIKDRSEYSVSVWCYKIQEHQCSPEEFESVNAEEDVFLMNGSRKCKRIYDDENGIVHLYYVWYWGDIEGMNFDERHEIQNKAIKDYEADGWACQENQIATRELKQGLVQPLDFSILKNKKG